MNILSSGVTDFIYQCSLSSIVSLVTLVAFGAAGTGCYCSGCAIS